MWSFTACVSSQSPDTSRPRPRRAQSDHEEATGTSKANAQGACTVGVRLASDELGVCYGVCRVKDHINVRACGLCMLVHQSSPTACRYALGVVMAYGSILVFRLLGSFVYRGQMVVYHCWRKGGSSHKIRVPRVATPTAWSEYTHGYAAPNSRGGASNVTDIEAASGFDGAGAGQRSCSDSDSYNGTRGGGTSASRASSRSRGRIHPSERL